MKIELKEIPIRDLVKWYKDDAEAWVRGYDWKLDIRPPYQREFIYNDVQRQAVIDTITKNFPLNVMYWAVREDGTYEVIDGQQRTISICQYINGDFAYMMKYFHNLQPDEQEEILNYKLMIYFCSGKDSEKLERFKTINIAWEKLTDQELRNAVYAGNWVSDAKRYFSKTGCPAYWMAKDYLNGSPIRQDYLETAIDWISKWNIDVYMANHQHDPNASALWRYFQDVITWLESVFTHKRSKFMKWVDWWALYNKFKDQIYDAKKIEEETAKLILDDSVGNKKWIYPYILTRDEKYLNIRAFTESERQATYLKQDWICAKCGKYFQIEEMEADHITPRSQWGQTVLENCQMLCRDCNRRKSDK